MAAFNYIIITSLAKYGHNKEFITILPLMSLLSRHTAGAEQVLIFLRKYALCEL